PAPPAAGTPGGLGLSEPYSHGVDRLHVLYKYRKVVACAILLSVLVGIVLTYTTATAYLGAAVVRAEPDSPKVVATPAAQAPSGGDPESFMQSELSLLRSRDLERRVVRTLRLDRDPQLEVPLR